jgi:hypothetical protein
VALRHHPKGAFLGGARSPRPDCKAELAPWHSISTRWGARGGWPTGDMPRSSRCPPPGVRSPPLRGGGPSELGWPCGGRPGDDAKGGFLGGARSPRPDCKALLMPRHFITRGGWPGGGSIMGTCLGQAGALLRACRARPSARWAIQAKKALRGKPGDNAGGGFLGGARSPRPHGTAARMARHCVATGAFPRSRWPRTSNVGVNVMPSSGRAEPAPPRGGPSELGWPCRGEGPR